MGGAPTLLLLLALAVSSANAAASFAFTAYRTPTPRHPRLRQPTMGGGIKQPRPSSPFDPSRFAPVAPTLPAGAPLPKLIVLDLDNTVWTPELYTLRQLPGYASAGPPGPRAGEDVWLIDGAAAALHELATCEQWADTKVAVASRTNKGRWAQALLHDFVVPGCDGRSIASMLSQSEIYTGEKTRHFASLHEGTGIAYEDMLFFDDSSGGKYGNLEPVSRLGVLCAHCPDGLTPAVWRHALEAYAQRKSGGEAMGHIVRAAGGGGGGSSSGSVEGGEQLGRVVKFFDDKGYGFVKIGGEQVFRHIPSYRSWSSLPIPPPMVPRGRSSTTSGLSRARCHLLVCAHSSLSARVLASASSWLALCSWRCRLRNVVTYSAPGLTLASALCVGQVRASASSLARIVVGGASAAGCSPRTAMRRVRARPAAAMAARR